MQNASLAWGNETLITNLDVKGSRVYPPHLFLLIFLTCIYCIGMASVDSSAPETTSSDNSPTLVRRNAATGHHGLVHHGPGSDSGSSHKSSDSVGSSGCDFQGVSKAGDNDG